MSDESEIIIDYTYLKNTQPYPPKLVSVIVQRPNLRVLAFKTNILNAMTFRPACVELAFKARIESVTAFAPRFVSASAFRPNNVGNQTFKPRLNDTAIVRPKLKDAAAFIPWLSISTEKPVVKSVVVNAPTIKFR